MFMTTACSRKEPAGVRAGPASADQVTNTNILNVRIKNKVVASGGMRGSVVLNLTEAGI